MRPRLLLVLTMLAAAAAFANEPTVIQLWPGRPPGETKDWPAEHDVTTDKDNRAGGRRSTRLSPVSNPTITVFSPDAAKNCGAAVLICPGGGYERVTIDIEGTEPAAWLNSLGVTAIVLKYRVPRREGVPQHIPPLQDAQRALGIVRQRAAEWGIDPHRIGMLGFSAGAHMTGVLSNNYETRIYPRVDEADETSCRPDFAMIIYPGYFWRGNPGVAPEVAPAEGKTPPTFIVQTEDDPVHVENAVHYFLALKQAKVPAEMHLYAAGGHGYGMRETGFPVATWPARAAEWMRANGWLEKTK